jgi:hypothetical protein
MTTTSSSKLTRSIELGRNWRQRCVAYSVRCCMCTYPFTSWRKTRTVSTRSGPSRCPYTDNVNNTQTFTFHSSTPSSNPRLWTESPIQYVDAILVTVATNLNELSLHVINRKGASKFTVRRYAGISDYSGLVQVSRRTEATSAAAPKYNVGSGSNAQVN